MAENIKEALKYAVDSAHVAPKTIVGQDGREYYDRNKYALSELRTKRHPKTLNLNTLNGLIDYLKSDMNGINNKRLMVVIDNPTQIIVCEQDDEDFDRSVLVTVEALNPSIDFGCYEEASDFNVMMQSLFVDSDDRSTVLEFASALKIEKGTDVIDNGISQVTTIKDGVASLAKATAPNPVTLRPYRTFAEVEQPASQFIFRISKNAEMALFEADGGKWRLDAINSVANYLKENLTEQTNITILA